MTKLPQVVIKPADQQLPEGLRRGWLVSCSCGWESYHPRRPGADRAAHEHRASHARKDT